jgi:xanthine dehydrogenase YagS FAD-binding subunit
MKNFELHEPATLKEALAVLARHGNRAKVLAGGSDLVSGIMKDWIQGPAMPLPEVLVDLSAIPRLRGIRADRAGFTIGAMTTLSEIVEAKALGQSLPLLVQSAASVASPLIRNYATLGGNLNQRPRCWFFRGPEFNCLRKGGDTCFSIEGDNRYHNILGDEGCYIVHPSDTATALLALNAEVRVASLAGERTLPLDRYFLSPGQDILRENVLKPEEVLVEVFIPTPAAGTRQAWSKLKNRQVYDFAVVSVAAAFTLDGGRWRDGRIALGGVAAVPYRASVIENQLKGKPVNDAVRQAAAALAAIARPMSRNGYKVEVVQDLVERTLLSALA